MDTGALSLPARCLQPGMGMPLPFRYLPWEALGPPGIDTPNAGRLLCDLSAHLALRVRSGMDVEVGLTCR